MAEHPGDPGQVFQLEVDPVDHPQMATGAELIGTLVYHALGYHVEDVYAIRVDPARITISDKATIRDASGRRRFNQRDLDAILRLAARDRDGRVYFSATRFHEGEPVGNFQYHGTRSDDPNDIHPHEHRRELRANRVFAAWLAHDDSRAVNTLDLLVAANGRKHVRHYMYDFGAILGSATRFAEPPTEQPRDLPRQGREPRSPGEPRLRRPALSPRAPRRWTALGGCVRQHLVRSGAMEGELPEPGVLQHASGRCVLGGATGGTVLRRGDSRDRRSGPVRRSAGGRAHHPCADRASRRHRTRLVERREPRRGSAPRRRRHADVRERGGRGGRRHARKGLHRELVEIRQRLGKAEAVGDEMQVTEERATAPSGLLAGAEFVMATIRGEHPDHPGWRQPVQVYFRRAAAGWETVGIIRQR